MLAWWPPTPGPRHSPRPRVPSTSSTLAPSDLRHPAEYELKPSDVAALKGADLIISTGFEVMAKKLAEAAGSQKIRMLQIDADYSLATMRDVDPGDRRGAGHGRRRRQSIAALESFMASWKEELEAAGLARRARRRAPLPAAPDGGAGLRRRRGVRPGPAGGGPDCEALADRRHVSSWTTGTTRRAGPCGRR